MSVLQGTCHPILPHSLMGKLWFPTTLRDCLSEGWKTEMYWEGWKAKQLHFSQRQTKAMQWIDHVNSLQILEKQKSEGRHERNEFEMSLDFACRATWEPSPEGGQPHEADIQLHLFTQWCLSYASLPYPLRLSGQRWQGCICSTLEYTGEYFVLLETGTKVGWCVSALGDNSLMPNSFFVWQKWGLVSHFPEKVLWMFAKNQEEERRLCSWVIQIEEVRGFPWIYPRSEWQKIAWGRDCFHVLHQWRAWK